VSTPMQIPSLPVSLSHPRVAARPQWTRGPSHLSMTLALYSGVCSSKSSQQTMDTTRTPLPSARRASAAFTAISTSDPVDRMMASGLPEELSLYRQEKTGTQAQKEAQYSRGLARLSYRAPSFDTVLKHP